MSQKCTSSQLAPLHRARHLACTNNLENGNDVCNCAYTKADSGRADFIGVSCLEIKDRELETFDGVSRQYKDRPIPGQE